MLGFIKDYSVAKGFPPSVREIGTTVGLKSSSTVHAHLNSLESKGYISRQATIARTIVILDKAWEELDEDAVADGGTNSSVGLPSDRDIANSVVVLPLLGRVAAGEPILALNNIEDSFVLPQKLVGYSGSFMLTIRGDSMIEAGINDGDYVVVR